MRLVKFDAIDGQTIFVNPAQVQAVGKYETHNAPCTYIYMSTPTAHGNPFFFMVTQSLSEVVHALTVD